MDSNILFRYALTDAWCWRLCEVSVSKKGEVEYREEQHETRYCTLDAASLEMIKNIIETHSFVMDYKSFDLESPNCLDGVMNFFSFASKDERFVDLMAFNIGEVRNPAASFSGGLSNLSEEGAVEHDIVPVKALKLVEVFDKIAEVLIKNGVNSNCLRLTYQ